MSEIENVKLEYERLRLFFSSLDSSKAELVDNLINEATFIKVQPDTYNKR